LKGSRPLILPNTPSPPWAALWNSKISGSQMELLKLLKLEEDICRSILTIVG
jgi:hypothetical protein